MQKGNREFSLATGMFIDSSYNVKQSFIEKSMNCIESLDFKNDPKEQEKYINNWIFKKTREKINELFIQGK